MHERISKSQLFMHFNYSVFDNIIRISTADETGSLGETLLPSSGIVYGWLGEKNCMVMEAARYDGGKHELSIKQTFFAPSQPPAHQKRQLPQA